MELPEHEAATFIPSAWKVLSLIWSPQTQQRLFGKTIRCLLTLFPAAAVAGLPWSL